MGWLRARRRGALVLHVGHTLPGCIGICRRGEGQEGGEEAICGDGDCWILEAGLGEVQAWAVAAEGRYHLRPLRVLAAQSRGSVRLAAAAGRSREA
eukprot:CAMPEP_0183418910 /NCGR_PEP_ID=MMETSP0370-20130417/25423_1 /TAXON_ID=268820 /ORGANISM="Peridinium aciculiferum, Strain PAER-2" /LENGTH=95 /DNA_ID=CAMNT_0025602657 /DNA_START=1 /DNA_END=285 /DNA_ORIENTATION=+